MQGASAAALPTRRRASSKTSPTTAHSAAMLISTKTV